MTSLASRCLDERRRDSRTGGPYYSAAKAASIHLTRCAAVELSEKGIRVNSLSPGMTVTGAFGKYGGMTPDEADEHPEYAEAAIAAILPRWQPLPYVARADDVAQAALFLASDASRMVTGHNLIVDGGISAGWPIAAVRPNRELFVRTFSGKPVGQVGQLKSGPRHCRASPPAKKNAAIWPGAFAARC